MPTFEEVGLSQEQEQEEEIDETKDDSGDNQQYSSNDDASGNCGHSSVVFPQIEEQAMEIV